MIEPTPDLRSEISSLQWLTEAQIKAQYASLLVDAQACKSLELLRAVVAYRLQERFYSIRLSDATRKVLEGSVAGNKILKVPEESRTSKRRIVRNWKGRDYEVVVGSDGRVEYEGKMYKSLTAVAKVITGSHWNGPVFFGVKK